MRAVIENFSPLRRRGWVDVAVPQALAGDDQLWVFGDGRPVARGIQIGRHSTLLHIFAEMEPFQREVGELTPVPSGTFPPFAATRWVTDDVDALIPRPMVITDRALDDEEDPGRLHGLANTTLTLVESNSARQVFHQTGRIEGTMLVWDAWAYFYSFQDAVPIEWVLTCSDPRTSKRWQNIDAIYVDSGEYVHIDYHHRLGMEEPAKVAGGDWRNILSGRRVIGDAEQMCWTGTMLTTPTKAEPGPGGPVDQKLRLDSLMAVKDGPMLGVCLDWDGYWLAFGATPRKVAQPLNREIRRDRFRDYLDRWGDMYDARPIGMSKSAADAGDREDFGATKGTLAITDGDPWWLYEARYSMSDYMRPCHYREANGSRVMAEDHPNWKTWSQMTWPRSGEQSKDTLGKPINELGYIREYNHPGSGYGGMDDQHRSTNNRDALYALTGSYALRSCMEDFLQVDLAQVPGRMGAARAIGRLFLSWANMSRLLDYPLSLDLTNHMKTRMNVVLDQWQGKNITETKPIRVLETGSDPDLREPDTGKRVIAWIVWQHSYAAMGFYAAHKVTADPIYLEMAKLCADLVTRHGSFEENGVQQSVAAIRYLTGDQEGDRLPDEHYSLEFEGLHVRVPPWVGAYWDRVIPAVHIARALGDEAYAPKIIEKVFPGGPRNTREAEWAAVVKGMEVMPR